MDMSFLLAGAGVAASGGLIYILRGVPTLIWKVIRKKLIYTVRIYQYDDLFEMIEKWFLKNHEKKYRDVEACLLDSENTESNRPVPLSSEKRQECKENCEITYKQEESTFVIRYMGKKLLVTKSKEKLEKAQSLKEVYFRKYTISGWGASKYINSLLEESVRLSKNSKPENEIRVSSNTSYGEWYSGSPVIVKPLESTILNPDTKKTIMEDIRTFLESEKWYTDVCIPYKRGYCLYGPPGTGKTTLALALANYTKRFVFCMNLNSIEDDSRLPLAFKSIPHNSILLIEDIDKVFSGRDNIKEESKITFSTLLNCLDGAFYKHGLITIITTNHIEKLDEALLRAGRIDIKIEIPKPSEKEISIYLSTFYGKDIKIKGSFNIKMSEVQEICLQNRNSPEKAIYQLTKNNLVIQE